MISSWKEHLSRSIEYYSRDSDEGERPDGDGPDQTGEKPSEDEEANQIENNNSVI